MNIALIMGCARSGTSILGELIGSHPDVRYKHEAHSIWNKAGLGENDSHRLLASHANDKIKRKIRRRFEYAKGQAEFLAEKCPRSVLRVPFIRDVFPEAKLVHIYRDGRDVACSLLPGIGGDEWKHLKPPNWKALFEQEKGIVRCAKTWLTVMEIALADLEEVPHLAVRYEELVQKPWEIAQNILHFLDLPEHDQVRDFCERIQNRTDGSYQPEKQSKWYRPDHKVRVGRWRENLSDAEAEAVTALLAPMLERLGYKT